MMAVKTVQRRHNVLCSEVLVAPQASVVRDHLGRPFTVTVAIKAGKPFHAHTMDHLIRMTVRTGLLVRRELVQITEMTLTAADILHKDMTRMAIGAAETF
jgi:hypothetical protein